MTKRNHDADVFNEPQFQSRLPSATGDDATKHATTEAKAEQVLTREKQRGGHERAAAMQSVFDEPFQTTRREPTSGRRFEEDFNCSNCGYTFNQLELNQATACPECGWQFTQSYSEWLDKQRQNKPASIGWMFAIGATLFGGLWAVVGTFTVTFITGSYGGFLDMVMIAPFVEELLKISLVALAIEMRSYWITRPIQLWLAGLGSAFGFSAIENLIYLNIYFPDPSASLIAWRWTVCVALHVGCTAIAMIGMHKLYRSEASRNATMNFEVAMPFVILAMVVHGGYNLLALTLEMTGFVF